MQTILLILFLLVPATVAFVFGNLRSFNIRSMFSNIDYMGMLDEIKQWKNANMGRKTTIFTAVNFKDYSQDRYDLGISPFKKFLNTQQTDQRKNYHIHVAKLPFKSDKFMSMIGLRSDNEITNIEKHLADKDWLVFFSHNSMSHDINFVCSAITPEDVTSLLLLATKEQLHPCQPYKYRSMRDAIRSKHDIVNAYKDYQTRTLVESLLHQNAVLKLNSDMRGLGFDSDSEDDDQCQDIVNVARQKKRQELLRDLKRERKIVNTRQKEGEMIRNAEMQAKTTNDCTIGEDSKSEFEFS
ncbi:hypothetical protein GCK72_003705 [Caenorhabditis remanei]|uniref:Uncharacterized protein n=1 Tax=Caenorhabditis remanei TaxID=31234 RepID=A0A6A5H7F4_CAERE|nr:hypothetical protein GCK72_003705 [Caenorhabditis remanei]KAF1763760.1 hypothetical protein GCK72_003705 [Caenorhabditis remanei]